MNLKKMLSKEITQKVNGHINEETVFESVNQFFRHGNTFLLLELILLRNEVKTLREELQYKQDNQANSSKRLIFPELL